MSVFFRYFLSAVFFLSVLIPGASVAGVSADDWLDFELFINNRFHCVKNFYHSGYQRFTEDRTLNITYVNPRVSAVLLPGVLGVFDAEAEWVRDFSRSSSRNDAEIRDAYVQTLVPGTQWATITAGRQFLSTVDGLIYDDSAPALRLYADFERGFDLPYNLDVLIARIERNSPYVQADLRYQFSFFEHASLHFGWYRDTKNGIAQFYDFLSRRRQFSSRSELYFYGIGIKKFVGPFLLRANVIHQRGRVRLRGADGRESMPVQAYLCDVNLDYSLARGRALSFFFFMASGDNNPERGTLRTFIAINPYIDKTSIFFNGGIDGQFSSDRAGLSGMQPSGVMAPGIRFDWRIRPDLHLRLVGAYLFAHTRSDAVRGRHYGWEVDCMAYYSLSERVHLFLELNMFVPGNYFRNISGRRAHTSTEALFGVTYFFTL